MNRKVGRTVLITGASGQLGRWTLRELVRRDPGRIVAWSGQSTGTFESIELEPVALEDREEIRTRLDAIRPDVVIHAAAMSAADDVRQNPERGRLVNEEGTRTLAEWCDQADARLVYTSTDLVFDGTKCLWREEDTPAPLLEYGRTKARSEPLVTATKRGLVARIALLYGPTLTGRPNFWSGCIDALRSGVSRSIFVDEFRTPLDYLSASEILCDLALERQELTGVIHVGGPERMSRYDLIRRTAIALGLEEALVKPVLAAETPMPEPRPRDVSLSTEKLTSWLPERSGRSPEEVAQIWTAS
jgi:dTDP-4-dehydrorhamnose reductase